MPIPTNIMKALSEAEIDAEESEEDRLERQVRVLREALGWYGERDKSIDKLTKQVRVLRRAMNHVAENSPEGSHIHNVAQRTLTMTEYDPALAATEKENDDE